MTHAEQCVIKNANDALLVLAIVNISKEDIQYVRELLVNIIDVTRYADEINYVSEEYQNQ